MAKKTPAAEAKTAPKKTTPKKEKKPVGLWTKIMKVQQNAQVVAKMGFNDFHKYKYAFEKDHIAEIKPLLGAEGLVLYLTTILEEQTAVTVKNGSTEYQVRVGVKYTIRDTETGQGHSVIFYGRGQDAGDKALPKAYTMANKYFLQKFFQLETADDDAETTNSGDKKGGAAAQPEETTEQKFEKAKRMISNISNENSLLDALEGVKGSKTYNKEQKAELSQIISKKIDEIESAKTA